MKKTKLLEIKAEADRFMAKLKEAIKVADESKPYTWVDDVKQTYTEAEKHCDNTKQAGSFKRSALDLKRMLSNL